MFDTTNYEDPISSFYVKMLIDRQTDKRHKQTDRQTARVKHNLLGGGNNPKNNQRYQSDGWGEQFGGN